MIYCPNCGTANLDGTRFCNECGEELGPQMHVECPSCGTLNPIQNVLCSECGVRLPPTASPTADIAATPAIKGLSLPSKNPAGQQDEEAEMGDGPEPEDDIPAWLHELGATMAEDTGSDADDVAGDSGEVPDWLRDLRASLPDDEAETQEPEEWVPDWLASPDPSTTEAETASETSEGEAESPRVELGSPGEPASSEAGFESEAPEAGDEPAVSEPAEDEVPGWLARLVPAAATEGRKAGPPAPESEDAPAWLTRLVPGGQDAEAEHLAADAETEEAQTTAKHAAPAPEEEHAAEQRPEAVALPHDVKAEATPASAEVEEDSVRDWLAKLQAESAKEALEEEALVPESEQVEIPDWLVDLRPADEEAEAEPEVPDFEIEEQAVADWAADLRPRDEETEVEAEAPEFEIEEGELPDWVADLQPADEEAEVETGTPEFEIEEGELPDWVADLQPADEEAEVETGTPEFEIEEGELPDWVTDLQPAAEEAEVVTGTPEFEIEEGDIPDWVAKLRPRDDYTEAELPLPSTGFGDEEGFQDRVAELEPPTDEIPLAEALVSADEYETAPEEKPGPSLPAEVEAILGSGVPAWLADLQVEAPEAAAAIIEETMVDGELPDWLVQSEIEPDDTLTPAEIPGWLLALKPVELREEGEEAEIPSPAVGEGVEETGLLAGIPGVLPVEMLIAQPRAIAAVEFPERAIEDYPEAQLFANVVGRTPEIAPKAIAAPTADALSMTARWFIYAMLIILVALPIIIGKPLMVRTIEPSTATVDMQAALESLGSGDPVLVAFDYDPSSSGEMDVIAQALLAHLMEREARIVMVSLLPAGPATSENLLGELVADQASYQDSYGERYANLGYLPGQASAVRLLGLSLQTALPDDFYGTPLSDLPVMQGLDSAQDFSLIVELAATHETLRWWIEQAGTPYSIPLTAGASAAVLPYALPYYESEPGQLVGLVGGVPDAVAYQGLISELGSPTDSLAARLDSHLAGNFLFVLVLLVGNVIYLVRRGSRRES